MKGFGFSFLIGCGLMLAGSALGLAFPWIIGRIFDGAFMRGNARALDRIALLMLGLVIVQAGAGYLQSYLLSATGERVIAKLRKDLFGHLLTLPPAFFADRRTGELTSRLGADVQMLQSVLTMNITELFRLTLTLIAVVVILFLKQPLLTAVTMGIVPIVVGSSWYLGERLKKTSLGVMDQIAEATAVAEEAFSQIRVVQSFVREDFERARYGARMDGAVAVALSHRLVRME